MTPFEKLERKFGRYAIRDLMRYFTVLYAIGFVISIWQPMLYYQYLALDPNAILHGQIWRLVTWLIYPPGTSMLWGLLLLYMYYSLGMTLENVWGTFRFNVFMFLGVIFHILAAFVIWFAMGRVFVLTPANLNLSIFLAFALTFPEMSFYLYFVIPVKAKYLAVLYGILELYAFFTGNMAEKVTIVLSLLNLFIFLASSGTMRRFSPKEMRRKAEYRRAVQSGGGEAKPAGKIVSIDRAREQNRTARHRCTVCGRTELDAPGLEFRYCSKCQGDHEYCMEHLYTHVHVGAEHTEADDAGGSQTEN